MATPNRIFLIGPMGAGKTTIGRQLAHSLGMSFADSDQEIQRRTGVDIPTIFEYEGEEGFRQREQQVIDELTQVDSQVLATGGGAVLRAENRQHLSARGIVVFLSCSVKQQYERTYRDRNRPLLQTEEPLERLQSLMEVREPLYRSTADYVVSTEGRSAGAVANEILELLRSPVGV
jgi:shikimate kinase